MKLVTIDDVYGGCKQLQRDDVAKMREWLTSQPHLPALDDLQIARFLHCCYFSNEAAKRCIDAFFTIRTHSPELFGKRGLDNPNVQQALNVVGVAVMPKHTPQNYGVLCAYLVDLNPELFNPNEGLKLFDIIMSMHFYENGPIDGAVVLIDFKDAVLGHLMRVPIMTVKKFLYYLQEGLPARLKEIHFVNAVSWMDKVMALIKPFMKKELLDILHIHQPDSDTLEKFVPMDCVPIGVGKGTVDRKACNGEFKKAMPGFQQLIKHEDDKFVVDESKRPGKPKTAGELFGVEGTFKKLDID